MSRARNEAAPINAQRFGIDTPCSKNGTCFDCESPQCTPLSGTPTTRFSRVKGRFQIILVDENLAFQQLFSTEICGTAYFVRKRILCMSKRPSAQLILMRLRLATVKVLTVTTFNILTIISFYALYGNETYG